MNGSRNSDDWGTPDWIRRTFEGWDDPCPLGSTDMDGLLRDWGDRTFANIPYSKPLPWIEKAIAESKRGKHIVLLVRVDTSAGWWFKLVRSNARFAYFLHRVDFVRKDDPDAGSHANIAVALVFFESATFKTGIQKEDCIKTTAESMWDPNHEATLH